MFGAQVVGIGPASVIGGCHVAHPSPDEMKAACSWQVLVSQFATRCL